jgi:hypothetical protein
MENLVRRSVRTTVAVAGLAALGVGLATPAFAVPGAPDVTGIGSGPTTEQLPGASTGFTKATDAMSTLPGLFQFAPPSADQSTPVEAAPESTESSEQAPAASPSGVLPSIPGSPVGAQANPQVSGPTDGAMQALDAASLF